MMQSSKARMIVERTPAQRCSKMFSSLSDDAVIHILALASSWPHFFVRLTCTRFNRLSSAFRAAATSETLVIASDEGVWIMNQERGWWVECAPIPEHVRGQVNIGITCGGEVIFDSELVDGEPCIVAFDPKLNTWREIPSPIDTGLVEDYYCIHMAKLDGERVR